MLILILSYDKLNLLVQLRQLLDRLQTVLLYSFYLQNSSTRESLTLTDYSKEAESYAGNSIVVVWKVKMASFMGQPWHTLASRLQQDRRVGKGRTRVDKRAWNDWRGERRLCELCKRFASQRVTRVVGIANSRFDNNERRPATNCRDESINMGASLIKISSGTL